jgi:NTE family protein
MKRSFFLLLLVFPFLSFAQNKPVIKNLIFEGSGIRGIAFCGSISEIESRHLMQQVEKVGGTSAGAIMALTVALGYSGEEIREIIGGTNFKKFNDGHYMFVGGINRTHKYFGWYRGNRFEKWLDQVISKKTGNADITFAELSKKGFKELYITGTCLNKQQLVVFSKHTYPNMKIKDAVRISMSVPLYFEAVFIDANGAIIKHPKEKQGLDVMIDGGLIGNFPIRMFDSAGKSNPLTLGFRIDSDQQIKNDERDKEIAALPVTNFNQYLTAFYNMVIENLNRQPLTVEDWQRTVSIPDGKIGPRIRKLSPEEINTLIENGRQAAKHHFN